VADRFNVTSPSHSDEHRRQAGHNDLMMGATTEWQLTEILDCTFVVINQTRQRLQFAACVCLIPNDVAQSIIPSIFLPAAAIVFIISSAVKSFITQPIASDDICEVFQ
jgi:hypothetical protein